MRGRGGGCPPVGGHGPAAAAAAAPRVGGHAVVRRHLGWPPPLSAVVAMHRRGPVTAARRKDGRDAVSRLEKKNSERPRGTSDSTSVPGQGAAPISMVHSHIPTAWRATALPQRAAWVRQPSSRSPHPISRGASVVRVPQGPAPQGSTPRGCPRRVPQFSTGAPRTLPLGCRAPGPGVFVGSSPLDPRHRVPHSTITRPYRRPRPRAVHGCRSHGRLRRGLPHQRRVAYSLPVRGRPQAGVRPREMMDPGANDRP